MSEQFVGEIRMFAGNFAPRSFALCDGQLIAVSQNDALFSLLGTIYGGDGRTTFGLPDLRGRVPVHAGTGPGLAPVRLGAKGGAEKVTLTSQQLPSHTHTLQGTLDAADEVSPANHVFGSTPTGVDLYGQDPVITNMNAGSITKVGGSLPHDNLMPTQCINYIIALYGIYPSRS